jgi:hypothetical protein
MKQILVHKGDASIDHQIQTTSVCVFLGLNRTDPVSGGIDVYRGCKLTATVKEKSKRAAPKNNYAAAAMVVRKML